uniref:Uncharacterized protein n=1 Tax=Acrobeloides nanus TaxID=290746 RepID=A0A914DL84_9BILA
MELEGVKRCLSSLESEVTMNGDTVDKHNQVVSFLQSENKDVRFDPWHRLKALKKDLRCLIKSLDNEEDKQNMTELSKRFIIHVYASLEKSNGDAKLCQELVFSFFLHVQGIHQWPRKRKYIELILANEKKVCPRFKKEKFETLNECRHITEATHPDSNHEPIAAESKLYQTILELVAKTAFMNDLGKMRIDKMTSYVENFHSVAILYRTAC